MNNLVAQNSRVPAHLAALLANTQLTSLNAAAAGGISSGGWPRISIKGGRFRLQSPQGEEVIVPQHWLDVVLVDANPNLSKIFYKEAYNPAETEFKMPDCFSDNGVAPSKQAKHPQCGTCEACPHNVWGSKITPNGKQTKACSDVKKVAVLIADNTSGPVFEFRIPPASLSNFGAYIKGLESGGIDARLLVTRVQFDTTSDFPKVLFDARPVINDLSPYVTVEQMQDVLEVVDSEETAQCTGKKDVPIQGLLAGPVATSLPAAPAHVQAALTPLPQGLPPIASGSPNQTSPTLAEQATPKRRGRAPAPTTPQYAAPPAPPPIPATAPAVNAAAQTAPLTPPVTDAALDELIAKAMAT